MDATKKTPTTITAELSTTADSLIIQLHGDASERNMRAAVHLLAGDLEYAIGSNSPTSAWTVHADVEATMVRLDLRADSQEGRTTAKSFVEMVTAAWKAGFRGAQEMHVATTVSWWS